MKSIKKTLKRGLAVFLCLVMSMGILQTSALAAYEWRTVTLRPTSGLNLTTKVSVGDTVRSYNGNASYTVKEIKSQYGERTTIVLNAYLNNNGSFYFPKATDLWNVPSGKAVDYVYWSGNGSGKKTENGSGLTSNGAAGANVGTGVYYFKNVTPPSVTYTLNYNANGGAGAPAAQTGSSTTGSYTFTISSTVPTKTGYTFKGWSTSSSATSASYQPGNTINVTGTTTLYAVWEAAPAKDVQQTGEGTVTIRKRFVGADMPASFLMTYDISNSKLGLISSDVVDFSLVSGTQYSATIKYPIWTFTGDWTAAEKAQYNSQIVLSELDANIQGKDLTITATGGAEIDNDAQTISYTVGAEALNGGIKVITNTYTDNTPPTPAKPVIEMQLERKDASGQWYVDATGSESVASVLNPQEEVRYTITVTNPSNVSLGQQTIVNDLPFILEMDRTTCHGYFNGVEVDPITNDPDPEEELGLQQIWVISDFTAGGVLSITYEAIVNSNVAGTVINSVVPDNTLTVSRIYGRVDVGNISQFIPSEPTEVVVTIPNEDSSDAQAMEAVASDAESGLGA